MPKNGIIRPTTDKAREALFNILNNRIDYPDLSVLDLFTGTGAMSLEFISRGAKYVTAVELNRRVAKQIQAFIIEKNIDLLDIQVADVFKWIAKQTESYDLIFADPPYAHAKIPELPEMIFNAQLLNKNGLLIIEHPAQIKFRNHEADEIRVYGQSAFSFFSN